MTTTLNDTNRPKRNLSAPPDPRARNLPPISIADAAAEPPADRVFHMPEATLPEPKAALAEKPAYAARAATIHLTYHGVPVDLHRADVQVADIEKLVDAITAREGWAANGNTTWPTLPDGTPICPRHGVPMRLRERQGDSWWSHNVAGEGEEPCYCRGYAGKSSPGWDHR